MKNEQFARHLREQIERTASTKGRRFGNMTRRILEQQHRARGLNFQFNWSDCRFREGSLAMFAAIHRPSSRMRE